VDVVLALKRMGNNQGLLQRALVSFLVEARALPQRLALGLQGDHRAQVLRELHAFKGLSATVGVAELSGLAARAEKLLQAAKPGDEYRAAVVLLEARLTQLLPVLDGIAARLAPAAATVSKVPAHETMGIATLQQLKELRLALQASDMGAMELHARLGQSIDESLAESMDALNEAMADLEFDQAATECDRLIRQFETT
jgi:HPt (histidine-containing phosphotransfer) domain-containing protein